VRIAARDRLRAHLAARGIETLVHYPRALHQLAAFRGRGRIAAQPREAVRAAAEVLSLPIYPELPPSVCRGVIAAVNAFAGGAGPADGSGDREQAAVEVRGQQALRIAGALQGVEALESFAAERGGERLRGERAVLGEIEATAGVDDERVELRRERPEPAAIAARDLELERQRVAVYRVGHEEG